MINMVFMIIFIALSLGILGFSIYRSISLVRSNMPSLINYPNELKKLCYLLLGGAVSTTILFIFLAMYQNYPLTSGEWAMLIFGSFLFGLAFNGAINGFILHYYAKELTPKIKKLIFYSFLSALLLICIGLILLTNSFADYLIYPLVNGLSFSAGFVNPASGVKPSIAWYAICILAGAVLVYFVCDHRYYVEYGKHGILEALFFVAFPAGIIGARLGYVIGEWNHGGVTSFAYRVAHGEWWAPFAIWEGGLTVISGALIGIVAGVIFFIFKNRKYSIWMAIDIIVPTILIAQAVGRWGNLFNCEVHGVEASKSLFWWVPKIIVNNAQYSESHAQLLQNGNIWVPLFYIESIANLFGYFFIRVVVGKGLKKYRELGDLAFLYIGWYGLTRVIMEPLRDTNYNMGNDGYWSWFWSFFFVLMAAFLIAGNHVVRYIISKKKGTLITINNSLLKGLVSSIALLVVSVVLISLGAIYMAKGERTMLIAFNEYNNGLVLLLVGLSVFTLLGTTVPYLLQGLDKNEVQQV